MGMEHKQLTEILARAEKASPAPWKSYVEGRDHRSGSSFIMVGSSGDRRADIELLGGTTADQDFIAHARQDVPLLVAEIRRLQSRLAGGF